VNPKEQIRVAAYPPDKQKENATLPVLEQAEAFRRMVVAWWRLPGWKTSRLRRG